MVPTQTPQVLLETNSPEMSQDKPREEQEVTLDLLSEELGENIKDKKANNSEESLTPPPGPPGNPLQGPLGPPLVNHSRVLTVLLQLS